MENGGYDGGEKGRKKVWVYSLSRLSFKQKNACGITVIGNVYVRVKDCRWGAHLLS